MDKVTFVVSRFGEEINGGAEVHCRMLAKRLSDRYEVEILTTCIQDYRTFDQPYRPGDGMVGGLAVKRFATMPFNAAAHQRKSRKAVFARKLRRMLYRLGWTRFIFSLFPVWRLWEKQEYAVLQADGYYSNDMLDYLKANAERSKAVIVMSYPYSSTHFCAMAAPSKTILIPTAHEESMLFYSVNTRLFSKVAHIAFNTRTEQQLCKGLFKNGLAASSIVATGVELSPPGDAARVRARYGLPQKYILYFGRVCPSKTGKLFDYFTAYRQRCPDGFSLVLTGGIFMDDLPQNDHIRYTGFVSEEDKTAIIEQAYLVVNPSYNESLSLLMLEAMQLGKTVLVNGKCKVMKQHCEDSSFAADYYLGSDDFCTKLDYYDRHPQVLADNRSKARKYVEDNYRWDSIIPKLEAIISSLE